MTDDNAPLSTSSVGDPNLMENSLTELEERDYEQFLCPICLSVMIEPVVTPHGQVYVRDE
jgi:hypothetical protein